MSNSELLVNRVASSGLITINLEDFFPKQEMVSLDIKQFLFRELLLKELDFRKALQELDWSLYKDKVLCVYCSSDAIIPTWTYMLIARYAHPVVHNLYYGKEEDALNFYFDYNLRSFDWSRYKDSKVVIKGCSDKPVPSSAYQTLTYLLLPYCSSIMYGEPCSTVPIFKAKKESVLKT